MAHGDKTSQFRELVSKYRSPNTKKSSRTNNSGQDKGGGLTTAMVEKEYMKEAYAIVRNIE